MGHEGWEHTVHPLDPLSLADTLDAAAKAAARFSEITGLPKWRTPKSCFIWSFAEKLRYLYRRIGGVFIDTEPSESTIGNFHCALKAGAILDSDLVACRGWTESDDIDSGDRQAYLPEYHVIRLLVNYDYYKIPYPKEIASLIDGPLTVSIIKIRTERQSGVLRGGEQPRTGNGGAMLSAARSCVQCPTAKRSTFSPCFGRHKSGDGQLGFALLHCIGAFDTLLQAQVFSASAHA